MNINSLRKKIDVIDRKLLSLLNARGNLAKAIGKLKDKIGKESYATHREKKIITDLTKHNKGPLPSMSIEAVYREILHACRSLESKIRVSYFGPEATYTHLAALKNFGAGAEYLAVKSIADVFTEVEKNRADYGVVPIENSTEGIINHTLDMFIDSDLLISSEVSLLIEHCLLSNSKELKNIKKLYSHTQPLVQCRNWLEENLPNVHIIEVSSTAEAAIRAVKDKASAAIASKAAALLYNLEILVQGIEDSKENYTRFLVIGKNESQYSGKDKTSIMFSVKDRVGILHDMLIPFKKYNINLTKIESRPTKKRAWEYIFFIDFLGHNSEKRVKNALRELKESCVFLKVLGSYPKAE